MATMTTAEVAAHLGHATTRNVRRTMARREPPVHPLPYRSADGQRMYDADEVLSSLPPKPGPKPRTPHPEEAK